MFVDDVATAAKTERSIKEFRADLFKLFNIHDHGEIKVFLGASIIRDSTGCSI